PHIYLIRFQNQCETATENNETYANSLSSIISRTPGLASTLPKDLRIFEDYSAFIDSTASLWVWSLQGLKQERNREDPNRGNFIYERQVLMELLEYGYMLHRGFYHRAEKLQSTDQVMNVRRFVLQLRLRMREVSHSGEIRNLLESGWRALGLPILVSDINDALALREAEMRSVDTVRATKVGWVIAIVFGIVAIPALADQIVVPAWHVLKLQAVSDPDKMKLLSGCIAIFCILAILSIALWAVSMRNRRL
ncbi:MAG: hypothetical protein ABR991_11415, partial [Terracidiphilus sp.]